MKGVIMDGSQGEGGGQIIRNAMCYAALLKRDLRIHSVRALRSKPGLRPQHLTGLHLAVDICGGNLIGASVGSNAFEYHPDPPMNASKNEAINGTGDSNPRERVLVADIGTAGSICLLLQIGFPCILMGLGGNNDLILELRGGTNAELAPQIDYMEQVFLPTISTHCFGLKNVIVNLSIERRGYYPRGCGIVKFSLSDAFKRSKVETEGSSSSSPLLLHPITMMNRGRVTSISIKAFHAGKVPRIVAQKLADAALGLILSEKNNTPSLLSSELQTITPAIEIVRHDPAIGSASGIILVATTSEGCILGGSSLGRKGEDANLTGEKAARELLNSLEAGGCVDDWLQDQLILFAALAKGESRVLTGSLTLHTQSAIRVAEEMTGATFEVTRIEDCVKINGNQNDNNENDIINERTHFEKKKESADSSYGMNGYISGKHIISCHGIGFGLCIQ